MWLIVAHCDTLWVILVIAAHNVSPWVIVFFSLIVARYGSLRLTVSHFVSSCLLLTDVSSSWLIQFTLADCGSSRVLIYLFIKVTFKGDLYFETHIYSIILRILHVFFNSTNFYLFFCYKVACQLFRCKKLTLNLAKFLVTCYLLQNHLLPVVKTTRFSFLRTHSLLIGKITNYLLQRITLCKIYS